MCVSAAAKFAVLCGKSRLPVVHIARMCKHVDSGCYEASSLILYGVPRLSILQNSGSFMSQIPLLIHVDFVSFMAIRKAVTWKL